MDAVTSAVPLVIAHRGASEAAPEHTMHAYDLALAQGADGLECDIRLTADEELVLLHDRTLERTSNGHGTVATHTLEQLRVLDFGSWHHSATGPAGVLTLREYLARVEREPDPPMLCIETKHPTRFGGLLERRLVEVLREFGLTVGDLPGMPRVRVMSFSMTALRRMRQLAPRIPLVQLIDHGTPRPSVHGHLLPGVRTAGIAVEFVREKPSFVTTLRARGHDVFVWTVNDPVDMARCIELGVAAIITDHPRTALDVVAGHAAQDLP